MRYLIAVVVMLCSVHIGQAQSDADRRAIADLEAKLEALNGQYDSGIHDGLRHHYGRFNEAKSMSHVEIILQHEPFHGYMRQILSGWEQDKQKAAANLLKWTEKYPELTHLVASCRTWIGDMESDRTKAADHYRKALAIKKLPQNYREAIEDRMLFDPELRKPWPKKIEPPKGLAKSPGPWSDPTDETV